MESESNTGKSEKPPIPKNVPKLLPKSHEEEIDPQDRSQDRSRESEIIRDRPPHY